MAVESPSAAALLAAWEQGSDQPPTVQALVLLAAAQPDLAPATLRALPIGRRDSALLALRTRLFAGRVDALTACPRCAAPLDLIFDVADIQVPPVGAPEPVTVEYGPYAVTVRLPDSSDLAALAGASSAEAARALLLTRCVLRAQRDGVDLPPAALPAQVADALEAALAAADPQADVQLDLTCAACDHHWQAAFDIVRFLWAEIHAWAGRLLRDVHTLASAYGWSEEAILALSPRRRQHYLELVSG